jgi:hypothetical protein
LALTDIISEIFQSIDQNQIISFSFLFFFQAKSLSKRTLLLLPSKILKLKNFVKMPRKNSASKRNATPADEENSQMPEGDVDFGSQVSTTRLS